MSVDICTCITDYEWNEDHRPELRLSVSDRNHTATLMVGRNPLTMPALELSGSHEGVLSELEGYAEIFAAAVSHLRASQPNAEFSGGFAAKEKQDE